MGLLKFALFLCVFRLPGISQCGGYQSDYGYSTSPVTVFSHFNLCSLQIDLVTDLGFPFCSYPFLLVDRVIEYNPGVSAVGIKNVTINDQFFNGHFPGRPIMPGVLMIEVYNSSSSLYHSLMVLRCD